MEIQTETLQQFYKRTMQSLPAELSNGDSEAHFNMKRRAANKRFAPFNRRDYYKICLVIGKGMLLSEEGQILIDQPAILFSNPNIALSYQPISEDQGGFYCLFNEAFINGLLTEEIKKESPLFNQSLPGVFLANGEQVIRLTQYFMDMEDLVKGDYRFKTDMIRSILQALIHDGIRIQQHNLVRHVNPSEKIVSRFFHLLSLQFPVDSPANPLQLLTPSAYAKRLNVHVNYLNSRIKQATGKTTSEIIHNRIVTEAKSMLVNTDWDVAEIAYSFGFEYASHFNKYFKKHTLVTPLSYRHNTLTVAV